LRSFQQHLFETKILTVVGYSFQDKHINHYISQWLNLSQENQIRIVALYLQLSHFSLDVPNQKPLDDYHEKLAYLQRRSPEKVQVINKSAGEALKELYEDFEFEEITRQDQPQ
jgi:hypothetical protein